MKGDWEGWSGFPDGGIDARKYAALMSALGAARGSLGWLLEVCQSGADKSDGMEDAKEILRRTSLSAISQALGLNESDLAIDPEDYLTREERERLRIGAERDPHGGC
jgi:hypothetical protein